MGDLKTQLRALLDGKDDQVHQAGMLGQRVLAQQMELQDRIMQLQEVIDVDGEDQARERYEELERTLGEWDEENAALSAAFGPSSKPSLNGVDPTVSEASGSATASGDQQRVKSSTAAAAQSRRAKNAAHRADDVEFAFEIGSGLLNEVRRLQSLLGERDKAIQDMKEEKDDLEASLEGLKSALKAMEANADKYKEENWNLEVSLQDLRQNHASLQSTHTKLSSEHKVLTKQHASSVASSEALTTQVSSLESQLEELKNKHDTDLANARKHAAGLSRDKSDLQQSVDALKAEVAKSARRFPKFGSPLTPNGDIAANDVGGNDFLTPGDFRSEADPFSAPGTVNSRRGGRGFDEGDYEEDLATALGGDITPDGSPIKRTTLAGLAPNHPDNELEVLKERLVLAQRQIGTLKTALLRERSKGKTKRTSLDGGDDQVGELGEDDTTAQAVPRLPQFRVGGAGRGRGGARGGRGVSLTERFRQVQSRAKGISNDEEEELVEDFDEDLLQEEQDNVQGSPSPASNRASVASVEGMDPMFANVLKRAPSVNGTPSPLHHSVLARSARGGRGRGRGGAIPSDRPRSLVGTPEDLAAALGVDNTTELDDTTVEAPHPPTVETAEFGCQAEPEMLPPSPPKLDMEIQTEAEPRALTRESGVQSTPSKGKPPLMVSTGTSPAHERRRTTTLTQQNIFALTPRTVPPPDSDVEESDAETETGLDTGTETDMDDYMDARQSLAGASTPNLPNHFAQSSTSQFGSSIQDFHSVMTMSDVDASDYEDDGDSIKASMLSGKHKASFYEAAADSPLPEPKEYVDKGIGNDEPLEQESPPIPAPPVPVVVEPEVKKPEVREVEIQTDPWLPPAPPPVPFPGGTTSTPGSPTLFKVGGGPAGQGFTFIPHAAKTSLPTPTTTIFKETDTGFRQHAVSLASSADAPSTGDVPADTSVDASANLSTSTVKGLPPPVDKSKPPTMMVPPPPRAPPPPGTMAPPSFIPERRAATDGGAPPPRPSSPPPADLIQRATTPTFGTVLSLSNSRRGFGGSMPPPMGSSSQGIRALPSTSSFRSAGLSQPLSVGGPQQTVGRKEMSTTSLTSDRSARSSISSDQNPYVMRAQAQLNSLGVAGGSAGLPHHRSGTRNPSGQTDGSGDMGAPTDPAVIHAITQTMIGEFLYKYTRKPIGKGYGDKRHKRFFWVHPYTRTLYWSSADPGSTGVSESSAKSAYIEGVRAVLDPNPMPPGLYQYSVVVSTPQREMKFTAPTKDRHEIWMNALKYLLSRPNPANFTSPGQRVPESPRSITDFEDDDHHQPGLTTSPQSQRSRASTRDVFNTTPRGQRSRSQISVRGSIGKRSGTPAAEYLRWNGPESPYSPTKSFVDIHGLGEDELDFELHGDSRSDDGYEGLENVRACCDGRHTVGGPHHHHHHHHSHPIPGDLPDEPASHPERPVSPSAWSFRSRTGSHTSHDGGASLFSWGRDAKQRFGSRRSTKTVASAVAQAQ